MSRLFSNRKLSVIDENSATSVAAVTSIDTNVTSILADTANMDTNIGTLVTSNANILTDTTAILADTANIDANISTILEDTGSIDFTLTSILTDTANIDTNIGTLVTSNANILTDTTAILADTANMDTNIGTLVTSNANILTDTTAILADTANMDTNLGTIAGDTTSLDTKTLAHTTLKAGHSLFVDTGASTDLAQDFSSANEVISFTNPESGSDIFVYEIVVAFYTAGSLTYTDYFTAATGSTMIIERHNGSTSEGTITGLSTNLSMVLRGWEYENTGFGAHVYRYKFQYPIRLPDGYNIRFTAVANWTGATLIKMCAKYYVAE